MKIVLSVIGLILLSGCAQKTPLYEENSQTGFTTPKNWNKLVDNGSVNTGWVKEFNDPILVKLVEESLKNNPQIRVLQAQLEQTKALVKIASSSLDI